jgi:hypothetical protein
LMITMLANACNGVSESTRLSIGDCWRGDPIAFGRFERAGHRNSRRFLAAILLVDLFAMGPGTTRLAYRSFGYGAYRIRRRLRRPPAFFSSSLRLLLSSR